MLLRSTDACLLAIDIQEKLIPSIDQYESMLSHCKWLMKVAQTLSIPVLISEQYP